jgi:branched-chain amino acid transport system substrate-binding protein
LQVWHSVSRLPQAADPIKIGVSGPFTGGSAPMGVSMRDGVKLAVAEINAKGGVLGRQIQLVERDDEGQERTRRADRPGADQQGKGRCHRRLHQHRRGLASQRFYQEAKIPVMNNVATGSIITKQFADQPRTTSSATRPMTRSSRT